MTPCLFAGITVKFIWQNGGLFVKEESCEFCFGVSCSRSRIVHPGRCFRRLSFLRCHLVAGDLPGLDRDLIRSRRSMVGYIWCLWKSVVWRQLWCVLDTIGFMSANTWADLIIFCRIFTPSQRMVIFIWIGIIWTNLTLCYCNLLPISNMSNWPTNPNQIG